MKHYPLFLLALLLGAPLPGIADELTLARLGFLAVPPERMAQFEAIYKKRVVPILAQYGLVEANQQGRATPPDVFSRLYPITSVDSLTTLVQQLEEDPAWQETQQFLQDSLEVQEALLHLYSTTALPKRTAKAVQGRPHWQLYNTSHGLTYDDVGALLVDRAGYLWICTNGGYLSRYDGQRFTHFTAADGLVDNFNIQIHQDQQGHIWLVPEQARGINHFDGQNWQTFTTADGLADDQVNWLYEDRSGALWFSTKSGLNRYDGQNWQTFTTADGLSNDWVETMVQGHDGVLWFGSFSGLNRYDGQSWQTFTTADGLSADWIRALAQGHDGALWIVTKKGLSRFDGSHFATLHNFTTIFRRWEEIHLLVDRSGQIWLGTPEGVSRYDGQSLSQFSADDGLAHGAVRALIEDRSGQIWIGTPQGVSYFNGKKWTTNGSLDRPADVVSNSIVQDQSGLVWYNSSIGLGRYSGVEWTTFTSEDMALSTKGSSHGFVLSLAEDQQGHIWLSSAKGASRYDGRDFVSYGHDWFWGLFSDRDGTLWFGHLSGGISRYDGETWNVFNQIDHPVANRAFSFAQDRAGHIWSASSSGNGVGRYDGERWRSYTTADGLVDNHVLSSLVDERGHLWFGFKGKDEIGGITRYDGQTWQNFTTKDGLAHNRVQWILQDRRGIYWFATAGGVSRYDGETWQSFNHKDGLAHDWVETIIEDRRGHLWFGTQGGVSRYDGQVFQTLSRRDGLGSNIVWGILEDRAGQFWFGTSGGLTRFRPSAPQPPPVLIEAVVADRRYEAVDAVTLSTSSSLVAFEFHAVSFRTRPEAMVYRYRLQGYDQAWHNTHARSVEYEALPVGEYTFEVVAVDRDLSYSTTPAKVHLEIQPQTFTSPLRLAAVELEDVFASFYSSYSQVGLGQVVVANDGAEPLETTLRFFIPELMRQPYTAPLKLAPNTRQTVVLRPQFGGDILQLQEPQRQLAELSLEVPGFSIKADSTAQLMVYGRGALRWDDLGRAAAYITSTDPAVVKFARSPLLAFEAPINTWGSPLENLLQAAVLFAALQTHGLRYLADANTSYAQKRADQGAVDHIQYPAELLQSKSGDCDDLTVLYASLLENVGIATALVDYPGHISLLFDTGVSIEEAYKLPLAQHLYIFLDKSLWVPVEITQIDQSFARAWRVGIEQLTAMDGLELRQRLVSTAEAWQRYPATNPTFEKAVDPPDPSAYQAAFDTLFTTLQNQIDTHIQTTYLDALILEPNNNALRTRLLKLYLSLGQFDTAVQTGLNNLIDKHGDQAATHNHLGIAYSLQGEPTQAVYHLQQAIQLRPADKGLQRNLQRALQALGRVVPNRPEPVTEAKAGNGSKSAASSLDMESFYWIEASTD